MTDPKTYDEDERVDAGQREHVGIYERPERSGPSMGLLAVGALVLLLVAAIVVFMVVF